MTLICGQNVSLEELKGKTSEIEALLAQGKAGLAQLQAKATEALTALESVQVPIPSVALPNLQNEINSAVTALTADLNTAVASLPAKIAELQTTFSGLPSAELDGYIDQITTIVNTAVSSGSLTGFDPCSLFPNKEVATDGTIVEKAKKIETPNVNATPPKESAATFQPIIQHENEQPQKKASEISPSGLVYADVIEKFEEAADIIYAMSDVYWRGLEDDAVKAHDDYIAANSSQRSELINLQRNTGRKALDLYQNGKLSESVAKYYEGEQQLLRDLELLDSREALFYDIELEYLNYLSGLIEKSEWDHIIDNYAKQENLADDYFKWVQIQNQWDKYKQEVINRSKYLHLDNGSGAQ